MIAQLIEAFQKAGKNVSDSMALHKSSANKSNVGVNNNTAAPQQVPQEQPSEKAPADPAQDKSQVPATGTPPVEETEDKKGGLGGLSGMLKGIGGKMQGMAGGFMSDADEKELTTPEDVGIDLIEQFANNVNDYLYTYKKDNVAGEDPTVTHSGPTAQELLKVPGFDDCVYHDEVTDSLVVDTERLALATAGLLADVSKRLIALEEIVYPIVTQSAQQEEQGMEMQNEGAK